MEYLIFLAVVTPFVRSTLTGGAMVRSSASVMWLKVARSCLRSTNERESVIIGYAGDLQAQFERIDDVVGTCIQVAHPQRPIEGLRLKMELPGHPSADLQIGDPDFDALFHIEGSPTHVYAWLDEHTRRRLMNLRHYRAKAILGELSIASSPAGRVSLADESARRVSLDGPAGDSPPKA
jgi:hypothetical protein